LECNLSLKDITLFTKLIGSKIYRKQQANHPKKPTKSLPPILPLRASKITLYVKGRLFVEINKTFYTARLFAQQKRCLQWKTFEKEGKIVGRI
jgi:hypothetical protein